MPGMANKLGFPPKSDRKLGSRKEMWCEFHKGFGHDVEHYIALDYQLASLIKDGFLKEYLEGPRRGQRKMSPQQTTSMRCLITVS